MSTFTNPLFVPLNLSLCVKLLQETLQTNVAVYPCTSVAAMTYSWNGHFLKVLNVSFFPLFFV